MNGNARPPSRERKQGPRRVTPPERAAVEPDEHEALRRALGRAEAEGGPWVPVDFGCPDCRGVLYVAALGKRGWLSFRCRIGHAFAADTLLAAKENQLEKSLWDSLEVLDELVQLHQVLDGRSRANPTAPADPEYDRRISAARKHRRQLRRLIAGEGPAPTRARGSEDEGAS
jgi:two-component system chemotaxis response regulator CheB